MNKAVIYIHGKGGTAEEAEYYRPLFPQAEVIGFDYRSALPWEAVSEFGSFFDSVSAQYHHIELVAGSLGAYFALNALAEKPIEKARLISPIVNMEKLICDMMLWANVTEAELREKGIIETGFGEPLSWEYLSWVRAHPITWHIPTAILYGSGDHLQSYETMSDFAARTGADLTVMDPGEHWFHTPEQMAFLDAWIVNGQKE